MCTVTVSVDVNYYRARYIHEMIFKNGESVVNIGYMYSSSIGAIVFEIGEIWLIKNLLINDWAKEFVSLLITIAVISNYFN